jgi:hypothetical protein
MRQNLYTIEFIKLLLGQIRTMSWTIVVLEKGTFSADQRRVALLQDVVDALQLLAVQLGIHGSTIRDQFKVHNAIDISPDAQHDFLAETILTSNRWRILISWNQGGKSGILEFRIPLDFKGSMGFYRIFYIPRFPEMP